MFCLNRIYFCDIICRWKFRIGVHARPHPSVPYERDLGYDMQYRHLQPNWIGSDANYSGLNKKFQTQNEHAVVNMPICP